MATPASVATIASNQILKKTVSNADAVVWLNELLPLLTDKAQITDQAGYTVGSSAWLTLPTDCLKVLEAWGTSSKAPYAGWEAIDGYIRFSSTGSYTIRYLKAVPELVDETSVIQLPERFAKALPHWIAYCFERLYFPGGDNARDHEQTFWSQVNQADAPRNRIQAIRVYR